MVKNYESTISKDDFNVDSLIAYERRQYLYNGNILKILSHIARHREIAIIHYKGNGRAMRFLNLNRTDFLCTFYRRERLQYRNYYMYYSLATYDRNTCSNNYGYYRKNEIAEFKKDIQNKIVNIHILLDFDGHENYDLMYSEVMKTKSLLDYYHVRYYILPSGNNFQILIYNYYKELMVNMPKLIAKTLKIKYDFKTIDLVGTGCLTKLCKLPFGLYCDKVLLPCHTFIDELNNKEKYDSAFNILSALRILKKQYPKVEELQNMYMKTDEDVKDEFNWWANNETPYINSENFNNFIEQEINIPDEIDLI